MQQTSVMIFIIIMRNRPTLMLIYYHFNKLFSMHFQAICMHIHIHTSSCCCHKCLPRWQQFLLCCQLENKHNNTTTTATTIQIQHHHNRLPACNRRLRQQNVYFARHQVQIGPSKVRFYFRHLMSLSLVFLPHLLLLVLTLRRVRSLSFFF